MTGMLYSYAFPLNNLLDHTFLDAALYNMEIEDICLC